MPSEYFLSIRNWEKYQHYRPGNRNVTWIKLYTNLLYDPDFQALTVAQKWFFVQSLLLAPTVENRFPLASRWWRRHSHHSHREIVGILLGSRLYVVGRQENDGTFVEMIEDAANFASKMLAQSRVDKSRIESPIVPLSISTHTEKQKGTRQAAPDSTLFDRFWEAYPRKENKATAVKAWARLNGDGYLLLEEIIAWLEKAKQSIQWQDKIMIPHASTFINQRRWEGEPPPRESSPKRDSISRWIDSIPEE